MLRPRCSLRLSVPAASLQQPPTAEAHTARELLRMLRLGKGVLMVPPPPDRTRLADDSILGAHRVSAEHMFGSIHVPRFARTTTFGAMVECEHTNRPKLMPQSVYESWLSRYLCCCLPTKCPCCQTPQPAEIESPTATSFTPLGRHGKQDEKNTVALASLGTLGEPKNTRHTSKAPQRLNKSKGASYGGTVDVTML